MIDGFFFTPAWIELFVPIIAIIICVTLFCVAEWRDNGNGPWRVHQRDRDSEAGDGAGLPAGLVAGSTADVAYTGAAIVAAANATGTSAGVVLAQEQPIKAYKVARLVRNVEGWRFAGVSNYHGHPYGVVAVAECDGQFLENGEHEGVPRWGPKKFKNCTCGFHAVLAERMQYLGGYRSPGCVLLEVELYGRVYEGDHALRATELRVLSAKPATDNGIVSVACQLCRGLPMQAKWCMPSTGLLVCRHCARVQSSLLKDCVEIDVDALRREIERDLPTDWTWSLGVAA